MGSILGPLIFGNTALEATFQGFCGPAPSAANFGVQTYTLALRVQSSQIQSTYMASEIRNRNYDLGCMRHSWALGPWVGIQRSFQKQVPRKDHSKGGIPKTVLGLRAVSEMVSDFRGIALDIWS